MATTKEIKVPDIGNAADVTVIEILVKPGDRIKNNDPIVTLESDKASMEIPSSTDGVVDKIQVKVGDKVSEGDILLLVTAEGTDAKQPEAKPEITEPAKPVQEQAQTQTVVIPDIGTAAQVSVIEVHVAVGDEVNVDTPIITLEGDKATMEIPAPYAGKIESLLVKVGSKVATGDKILTMKTTGTTSVTPAVTTQSAAATTTKPETKAPASSAPKQQVNVDLSYSNTNVHAGPGVRRFARELGVDLTRVKGTGPKNRLLKEDVQQYVKAQLAQAQSGGMNFGLTPAPEVDFAKYGEVETVALNKIKRLTGINLHRNWVTIPHVTQFDEADITDMEAFRQSEKENYEKKGVKLTPLVFIMKVVVHALKQFPTFNSSLSKNGEQLILKKYFNLGIAVDTPNGLVVPVIRDVDQKSVEQLAKELAEISKKAREKGLSPAEMSGSCFTISSLGGIAGTAFTPIVNAPDVAILGISKSQMKPVYQDGTFVPRLMLPLSLSYDHRVIDGAEGARFIKFLVEELGDIRKLLL